MVKKTKLANKTRPNNDRKGLYNLLAIRLVELERDIKERTRTSETHPVLSFPEVFSKLGPNFSCDKSTLWDFLLTLRDFEFLEIITGHGVRLNDKIGDLK